MKTEADDTQAIVIKFEAKDLLITEIETTGGNTVSPLNANSVKVEAIVDQPLQMEERPMIPLKIEVNDASNFQRNTSTSASGCLKRRDLIYRII